MLAIVAAILIAATWVAGWWGVPLVAAVVGALLYARRGIAGLTALAAVIAWSVLILVDGASGRFGVLAGLVGGTLQLPAVALLAVTLLFAALLAWSAAVLGVEIGRMRQRSAE
ncbi:MAG TPA: hypothetical protein VF461_02290 [Gemmatimonadaceae bacterium]